MSIGDPRDVDSREHLAVFVRKLADDLRKRPEEWENKELAHFLEAMSLSKNAIGAKWSHGSE